MLGLPERCCNWWSCTDTQDTRTLWIPINHLSSFSSFPQCKLGASDFDTQMCGIKILECVEILRPVYKKPFSDILSGCFHFWTWFFLGLRQINGRNWSIFRKTVFINKCQIVNALPILCHTSKLWYFVKITGPLYTFFVQNLKFSLTNIIKFCKHNFAKNTGFRDVKSCLHVNLNSVEFEVEIRVVVKSTDPGSSVGALSHSSGDCKFSDILVIQKS